MKIPKEKHIRYRDHLTIEEVDDPDGTFPVPIKGSVVPLHGKQYKVIWFSVTIGLKNGPAFYDVVVQQVA